MLDHVVVDVEIAKQISECSHGWESTDIVKVKERIEKRTNRDGPTVRQELGPCWLWMGAVSSTGYGSLRFHNKGYSAHAVAYFLAYGYFPKYPMEIRHRCDTRLCINPAHLLEGTRKQNAQDCVSRGRHSSILRPELLPRGRRHHNGKKSHCPRGHEYTPDNTYIINKGVSRACKICALARAKSHKAKVKCTT